MGPPQKSRDFLGSGKNRSRSRRESRDFGALRHEGARGGVGDRGEDSTKRQGVTRPLRSIQLWHCELGAHGVLLWQHHPEEL